MYPIPATTFTQRQCKYILAPVLMAGLPASGVVRTCPRAVVHGPTKYQGLGIPDLYLEQGIAHIEQIAKHCHTTSSITGQLLCASIQELKVEVGCPGSLFSIDFAQFGHLATDSWVKHTWQFLCESEITLLEQSPHLATRRVHDQFLIPLFQAAGFAKGQLQQINCCRLYMRVTTLSDLTDGSGQAVAHRHFGRYPERTSPLTILLANPTTTIQF